MIFINLNSLFKFVLISIFSFSGISCSKEIQHFTAEVVFTSETSLGKSAFWHPDRKSLFWVDIKEKKLYEYLPKANKCHSWDFNQQVATVVPESESTVIVAIENRIIRFNMNDFTKEEIASIGDGKGEFQCNGGKCCPNGYLWINTTNHHEKSQRTGKIYCVYPDGKIETMIEGIASANGFAWSKDKKYIYYNDILSQKVTRYRYDKLAIKTIISGTAVNIPRKTGIPNGMAIDQNDHLWVAQKEGFGVYCYNPYTGELLAKIEVPAPHVTTCTFGGENMDILYIVTSRAGLTKEELKAYPLSGSIFSCKTGSIGTKANYFGKKKEQYD